MSLDALLAGEFATSAQAELIQEICRSRQSFLITGATGTGKTTLLRAMLQEKDERVIAVEDVTELSGSNIISLQTKPNQRILKVKGKSLWRILSGRLFECDRIESALEKLGARSYYQCFKL
jgi:Flp pilus assembly CpaF family ATPase